MLIRDLVPKFNAQFGTDYTESSIRAALKNHGIKCGRPYGKHLMLSRLYTPDQAQFLRDNYPGRSLAELTAIFNEHFQTDRTEQQIKTFVHNRGIVSGRTGRFEKGHKPWNNGTKGQGLTVPNSGSFKTGSNPPNRKPVGSERIDPRQGYVLVKINEQDPYTGFPTRYKLKHIVVWEQHHGPVPAGSVVIFADGNRSNCGIANLRLVSRAELLHLNRWYAETPVELKPSALALTKLEVKVHGLARVAA
jgi:hypothetical protein